MAEKTLIIGNEKVHQKIERIAYEIVEHNFDEKELVLVGIAKRGYLFAELVFNEVKKIGKQDVSLESIALDKDNVFDANGINYSGELNALNGKTVIVIDDVLNSGVTLMYAVRHLLGAQIKKMNTAVLVDRRHRNFPIRADFAGLTLSTTLQEHIAVEFTNEEVNVYLV
ncbi:phosphoribosyltransferase family protein [Parvicella tangerina]|uniref:Bifunctional protein pyrR n=1 Tax=Parvicella tangerina TaxID=2829795 RepID=A0A916JNQ7_9FLAO|nr:phosphoribosyltransferase family protein [Parvicella tangerina]CAG5083391.1 Bifunctional protein pyrR [Parvicella tangerina]